VSVTVTGALKARVTVVSLEAGLPSLKVQLVPVMPMGWVDVDVDVKVTVVPATICPLGETVKLAVGTAAAGAAHTSRIVPRTSAMLRDRRVTV
jgi:hypothetical protein